MTGCLKEKKTVLNVITDTRHRESQLKADEPGACKWKNS